MKCIKRKTETGTEYNRVKEGDAPLLVARGWQYCSKDEYRRNAGTLKLDEEVQHG